MASKKKLHVVQVHNPKCDLSQPFGEKNPRYAYSVDRVVNSVTPHIHDTLSQAELAGYCEREDWDVTVEAPR